MASVKCQINDLGSNCLAIERKENNQGSLDYPSQYHMTNFLGRKEIFVESMMDLSKIQEINYINCEA